MKNMIDVVCVKWGDLYSEEYVHILRDSVARNTTVEHRFICFTDEPIDGIDCRPLPDGLQGWWNKLALFDIRQELNERVVYFDLDTAITGNIDFLMNYGGSLLGIENLGVFNKYEDPKQYTDHFQSGVLAWNHTMGDIVWRAFENQGRSALELFAGDGEFLDALIMPSHREYIQKIFPEHFLESYKYQVYERGSVHPDTSIVCFHGEPRPHQAISETVHPWGIEYKPMPSMSVFWRTGE